MRRVIEFSVTLRVAERRKSIVGAQLVAHHKETGEERVLLVRGQRPPGESEGAAAIPLWNDMARHEEKAQQNESIWTFSIEVAE